MGGVAGWVAAARKVFMRVALLALNFPKTLYRPAVLFLALIVPAFGPSVSLAADAPAVPAPLSAAVDEYEDDNDPIEPLNRFIFEFNEFFYKIVLRPATEIYTLLVPPPVREAVGNVLDNLNAPVVLLNDILQGEGGRAWQTAQRFVVNSTIGIAGIMDLATEMDIPGHDEDFGQTLAVWGVGEGFYLVLPLFGPSSPRDGIGKLLVDPFVDPVNRIMEDEDGFLWTRVALKAVDEYGSVVDELDQIKKTSIDYYAAIRSMYRQKRQAEISNGAEADLPPILDLSFEYRPEEADRDEVGQEASKPRY